MKVDLSGITKNPPSFIETWQGKSINFKLDKYIVSITQLSITDCIFYIENIAKSFALMKEILTVEKTDKKTDLMMNVTFLTLYKNLINIVYKLSKPYCKKWRYEKALYKKAMKDIIWFVDIVEQILDYWMYIKKKIFLLAKGQTLRQTVGESYSWNSLKLDGNGKILIRPRFESFLNAQRN